MHATVFSKRMTLKKKTTGEKQQKQNRDKKMSLVSFSLFHLLLESQRFSQLQIVGGSEGHQVVTGLIHSFTGRLRHIIPERRGFIPEES
jgi:hypothetical protein